MGYLQIIENTNCSFKAVLPFWKYRDYEHLWKRKCAAASQFDLNTKGNNNVITKYQAQQTFTCSKSIIETLEKSVKYVSS